MVRSNASDESSRDRSFTRSMKSAGDTSADAVRDVGRVVEAWATANTELWVGSLRLWSDLVVNLTEAAMPRRDESSGRTDVVKALADTSSKMAGHIGDAMAESTRIVQRSVESFSGALDEGDKPAASG